MNPTNEKRRDDTSASCCRKVPLSEAVRGGDSLREALQLQQHRGEGRIKGLVKTIEIVAYDFR